MKTNGDSTATRDILKGEVSPAQFATLWGQHKAIYPEHEGTLLDTLLKKAVSDANKTNQGLEIGEIDHPFDEARRSGQGRDLLGTHDLADLHDLDAIETTAGLETGELEDASEAGSERFSFHRPAPDPRPARRRTLRHG